MALKRRPMRTILIGFGAASAGLGLLVLAMPVLAQSASSLPTGLQSAFSIRQGFEAQRNPQLEPEQSDEQRALSNTDLSFGVTSATRSDQLEMNLGLRLRGAMGELDTGEDQGFAIDRPRLAFSHEHRAPGTNIRTTASVQRNNIGFLRREELLDEDTLPEDIDDLEGSGFRTDARLNFNAEFRNNAPFGWGVSLNRSVLSYDDVEGTNLEDRETTSAGLSARFRLSPRITLNTRLGYSLRSLNNASDEETSSASATLNLRRSGTSNQRVNLRFEDPDDDFNRFTLSFGGSENIDGIRSLNYTLGFTALRDDQTRAVAGLDYQQRLSRGLSVSAGLNQQVRDDAADGAVLDTVARAGLSQSLSRLSQVSFRVSSGRREDLDTEEITRNSVATLSYTHRLNRDWSLSVGASRAFRQETGEVDTSSDRLFFNIGRSWRGGLF